MSQIKLTSYGATGEVTGSCHLLEVNHYKILIDCGLFQGDEENYWKNWREFNFCPEELNAVILTHAHLDHCGRLPKLYDQKYKGKVYATDATRQIAQIILKDSVHIMYEKSAKHRLKPLYSTNAFNQLNRLWQTIDYYQPQPLNSKISFTFYQAGHILGAAIVEIKGENQTIIFTGDIGSENMPLVQNIDYFDRADYVIMEGTYGNRNHEDKKIRNEKLLEAVKRITIKNSTLLIPLFAVERTQDVLKILNDYYESHLDFNVPVFLDSPLATEATRIYQRHLNLLNAEAQETLKTDRDIFSFPHLKITSHIRQSKQINSVPPPKIILAGSGMAEGGRIIHHLARYASRPENNILFMGFQVPGTLGYKILNGAFAFDYYNKSIAIKSVVGQIDGFSTHADQNELLKWLGKFTGKPKKVFLVHGNQEILEEFSKIVKKNLKITAEVVKNNHSIILK